MSEGTQQPQRATIPPVLKVKCKAVELASCKTLANRHPSDKLGDRGHKGSADDDPALLLHYCQRCDHSCAMAALVQGLSSIELDGSTKRKGDAPLCRTPVIKRNEVAWKWYESIGAPKLFVAPLVGYSEPAFRLLCRSYGADIASTPMIDAAGYVASERYRNEFAFTGGKEDRPLTTQLGGSEPESLAAAAALVAPFCDAVELNMGCPQRCAKKNGSGAFLMEDLARATRCIAAMRRAVDAHNAASSGPRVATVVKIRCFGDVPRTIELARALEAAGAEMITVHGRTRHAGGGRRTAAQLANWAWIRAVEAGAEIQFRARAGSTRVGGTND